MTPRVPFSARLPSGTWLALDALAGVLACWVTILLDVPAIKFTGSTGFLGSSATTSALPPLAASVTVLLAMMLRRLNPVVSYAALLVVPLITLGSGSSSCLLILPAAYPLYLLAASRPVRESVTAVAAAVAVMAVDVIVGTRFLWRDSLPRFLTPALSPFFEALLVVLVLVVVWIAGFAVHQRHAYDVALRDRAAAAAVASERLRIARELHDVIAHTMSVIAVQAGFGQYVIKSRPREALEALAAIKTASGYGLEDLHRMIATLRNIETDPAGELADLPRLVERARAAGVEAQLTVDGAARELSPVLAVSSYRIITEALTNVMRHAGPGARCVIAISYRDDAMTITITDEGGAAPGHQKPDKGGHGLSGMRERAALCGGTLTAGPRPEGGFLVSARLPLSA
jgi:signal transduction histidine kinase